MLFVSNVFFGRGKASTAGTELSTVLLPEGTAGDKIVKVRSLPPAATGNDETSRQQYPTYVARLPSLTINGDEIQKSKVDWAELASRMITFIAKQCNLKFIVVFSLAFAYAYVQVVRLDGLSPSEKDINDWLILGARSSGILITFCFISGQVFVLTPIMSAMNEIPIHKRFFWNWKKIHVACMLLMTVWAAVHVGCHSHRVRFYFTEWYFEWYSLSTGVILGALILVHALPYLALKVYQGVEGDRNALSWNYFWRWVFRVTHGRIVSDLTALVFVFHADKTLVPLALCIIYAGFRSSSRIEVLEGWFKLTSSGYLKTSSKGLELIFVSNAKLPLEYGYYCSVEAAGRSSSLTMIPLPSTEATKNYFMFRVAPSVFVDAFSSKVTIVNREHPDSAKRSDHFRDFVGFNINAMQVKVIGPFHSTTAAIRDKSCERLVVMIGKDGRSVAETVIKFAQHHRGHFKNGVVILQLCSRQVPQDGVLLEYRLEDGAEPEELSLASDAEKTGEGGDMPIFEVFLDHVNQRVSTSPFIKAYYMFGSMDTDRLHTLLSMLGGDEKTHFLICSATLHKLLKDVYKKYTHMGELQSRIHVEEFQT